MSINPATLIPAYTRPEVELDGYPSELWIVELNGRRSELSTLEACIAQSLILQLEQRRVYDFQHLSMQLEYYGFRVKVITKDIWRLLGGLPAYLKALLDDK